MLITIAEWAARHGIHPHALEELNVALLRATLPESIGASHGSEAGVQQAVRFNAASAGCILWRNNVGALEDKDGRHVRYGLCNDSAKLNRNIKSHDLIGIRPRLITPDMVGTTIGQFMSREVKAAGWTYRGTDREVAQAAFGALVNIKGGDAKFTTGGLD